MEVVLELLVQLVLQLVVEMLLEPLFHLTWRGATTRVGVLVVQAVVGFAFGVVWGEHLAGREAWPRLLWVSLLLAVLALTLLAGHARDEQADADGWLDEVLRPPWRWSFDRLLGFALLNLAIAGGIVVGFSG